MPSNSCSVLIRTVPLKFLSLRPIPHTLPHGRTVFHTIWGSCESYAEDAPPLGLLWSSCPERTYIGHLPTLLLLERDADYLLRPV